MIRIEKFGNNLALLSPFETADLARSLPDRRYWKPDYGEGHGAWIFAPTSANVVRADEVFPDAEWSEPAAAIRRGVVKQKINADVLRESKRTGLRAPDFKFNRAFPPFQHQEEVFALSRDLPEFALFMEMGTGKTRIEVDTATYLRAKGSIDAVLVVCPNSVKDTWVEEVAQMAPEWSSHEVVVWSATAKKVQREAIVTFLDPGGEGVALKWFIVNVEGLSSDRAFDVCQRFLQLHRCLMIVDESSRIKTPRAKRTKNVIKLGKLAPFRRVMSGTPVTQGPLDLYTQFKFLDPYILGFSSFYTFRNRYAVMGGFNMKQVIGYSNLEELVELIDPYSYRVTRAECIDLPPNVFERLTVDLGKEQRVAYDQMKKDMVADHAGQRVSVTLVLTQMLRLQQIVGGFLPITVYNDLTELEETHVEPIRGVNAKMVALVEFLDDLDRRSRVIIWARFRAEIQLITETLDDRYGSDTWVEFHGGVKTTDRTAARRAFQDASGPTRFFVGQTETGGLGITLTAADTVVYYSNSFSLESRLQSEDRAHRIGQDKTVTYVDMVARNTLDAKLLTALRSKKNLADLITGDDWREWI